MEQHASSPESFTAIKFLWGILMVPITWVWHRNNALAVRLDGLVKHSAKTREDIAALKAHTENTKDYLSRMNDTLIRVEDKLGK